MAEFDSEILERLAPQHCECPSCGGPAIAVRFAGRTHYECDPCANHQAHLRDSAHRRALALAQWEKVTPANFQEPMDALLLHPQLRPVLEQDGMRGVALIGASYSGKTRVAYYLLRKAAAAGHSVLAITHEKHRLTVGEAMDRDPHISGPAKELLRSCLHARVLLIDDIGKGAKDERGDEAFFHLLNHRRDNRLVTHWTSNAGGKWMDFRFSPDKAKPIQHRLTDLIWTDRKTGGRPNIVTIPEPNEPNDNNTNTAS